MRGAHARARPSSSGWRAAGPRRISRMVVVGWPISHDDGEEEEEVAENLLLESDSCSRFSHVENWTPFPLPPLGSTLDTYSYVSLGGFWTILLSA